MAAHRCRCSGKGTVKLKPLVFDRLYLLAKVQQQVTVANSQGDSERENTLSYRVSFSTASISTSTKIEPSSCAAEATMKPSLGSATCELTQLLAVNVFSSAK